MESGALFRGAPFTHMMKTYSLLFRTNSSLIVVHPLFLSQPWKLSSHFSQERLWTNDKAVGHRQPESSHALGVGRAATGCHGNQSVHCAYIHRENNSVCFLGMLMLVCSVFIFHPLPCFSSRPSSQWNPTPHQFAQCPSPCLKARTSAW